MGRLLFGRHWDKAKDNVKLDRKETDLDRF